MLFLATFLDWPYGFFQLLRLVVCGAAIYGAVKTNETGRSNWTLVMAGIAVLFNPVFLITFSREEWQPIDFAVGVVFLFALKSLVGKKADTTRTTH